jgi:hypothetical protein
MRPGEKSARAPCWKTSVSPGTFNRQTRQPKQRRDAQVKQTPGKVMLGL